MKKGLLFLLMVMCFGIIHSQNDTINTIGNLTQRDLSREVTSISVSIYPVPVRENSFTIKADRDISFIKITNIIGQDIFRIQYNNPQQIAKILLDDPKRGMYLVTIIFSDGTRMVKKIMVEESK